MTRFAGRDLKLTLARYSQARDSFAVRVATVRRPAFTVMATVPEQPWACVTEAGRRTRPLARTAYGARRSRLGANASPSRRGVKRRTVTARTMLAVWLAPS